MGKVRGQRSIWFGIAVVVVFFAAVTLAIGWVGSGGPDIPHAVGQPDACTTCHATDRLPDGHDGRIEGSCRTCHPEGQAEPSVPEG